MIRLFGILIFLLLTLSCNEKLEQTVTNQDVKSINIVNKKKLRIEIDYISFKSDDFRVILNNIKKGNQKLNITFTEAITGSNKTQKLVFEMPFSGKPTSVSFGLGNKEVKDFYFKNIKFFYDENSFSISEDNIDKYFNFNRFVSYDKLLKKIITKKINNLHSPVITIKPIVKSTIYK